VVKQNQAHELTRARLDRDHRSTQVLRNPDAVSQDIRSVYRVLYEVNLVSSRHGRREDNLKYCDLYSQQHFMICLRSNPESYYTAKNMLVLQKLII
jgi:hypothetical protein